jgi:EAL and modified HD-GYP domain-containing signal transduction protein
VGQHKVKPLKMNYIELLNMVNKDDYDLTKVADVVARDTALAIALLKVVNRLARNSEIVSIKHGAAMLGQRELRSWINTVVVNEMYSDKPNEITRLSLLRAKFAETVAKDFEMAHLSQELFLMGLFSVVDLILEMPMEQAMEKLQLSKEIREVLTEQKGIFSDLYTFMLAYENANWEIVDDIIAEKKLEPQNIYNAYTGALEWYRDLFGKKR